MSFKLTDIPEVREAFKVLMAEDGEKYVLEIIAHGSLSLLSYHAICDATAKCSKENIIKYFGVVRYYYLENPNE